METGNVYFIFLIKILIFCSSVPCSELVLNVPLMSFSARCKVLSKVCFVYLCKACSCEGQCHEIWRALPSVCEKMWGVAAVKAECSGVGGKFLYLHSIWCKQNMANRAFSDGTHKVKCRLSCSPSQIPHCSQWLQLAAFVSAINFS